MESKHTLQQVCVRSVLAAFHCWCLETCCVKVPTTDFPATTDCNMNCELIKLSLFHNCFLSSFVINHCNRNEIRTLILFPSAPFWIHYKKFEAYLKLEKISLKSSCQSLAVLSRSCPQFTSSLHPGNAGIHKKRFWWLAFLFYLFCFLFLFCFFFFFR